MKKLIFIMVILFSLPVYAAGYTSWAVPTQLEYVNDGVLISGGFGNPGGCAITDKIFISRAAVGDEKFQSILSFALTALTAKKEIKFRSGRCFDVTFHGQNVSESTTAIYIR